MTKRNGLFVARIGGILVGTLALPLSSLERSDGRWALESPWVYLWPVLVCAGAYLIIFGLRIYLRK